ncbi:MULTISPECIES: hypothetical protein [unclassified Streptomyces]|uniref:hypothetical protein n=1 Tax=unclassified Streptomyces TaxID=2593676 RepID=UPI002DDAC07C|nr:MULTISPECIES: hypothetical protein [unclassified Streptomyces]WSA96748.1 hypothetical protein OIE63_38270 [Streptomyces sp. NBC_01795]WSS10627.1 hypothetical protein OG533_00880 [Streptomyces sp. NBC_01186]WSS39321.1 hypothetical protein OG220_00890 [Streptomyces sp. NBC_01187]
MVPRSRARYTTLAATVAGGFAPATALAAPASAAPAPLAAPEAAAPATQSVYCGYNDANYQPYWLSCSDQDREIKIRDNKLGEYTVCAPAREFLRIGPDVYQTTLAWETGRSCRA